MLPGRLIAWLFLLAGCAGIASGQVGSAEMVTVPISRSVFGLGVSAGLASGFGLSFRHHPPGNVSYQLIGGIIKTEDRLHADLGVELQYDFTRGETMRFFGDAAFGYFFSGPSGRNDLEAPVRMGFGLGTEWQNDSPLHLQGELLFTCFSDGTILPLPQIGLHYYFL